MTITGRLTTDRRRVDIDNVDRHVLHLFAMVSEGLAAAADAFLAGEPVTSEIEELPRDWGNISAPLAACLLT